MSARDRTILVVVGLVAAFAGFWFLILAPKRDEAQQLSDQVATEQARLEAAQSSAGAAQQAKDRYASDYATVARLGKAVPVQDDVPSLVYQLETAAKTHDIDFRSIKLDAKGAPAATSSGAAPAAAQASQAGSAQAGASTQGSSATANAPSTTSTGSTAPSSAPATPAAAAGLPPGATVGPASFPIMPFSFGFDGSFFGMEAFLREIDRFTKLDGDRISVNGRLLTIDGIAISASRKGFPKVKAAITATAYLLPAEQGLTAGATPQSPTPASSAGASTKPSTPSPTATASVR